VAIKLKKILAPTDLSKLSRAAISYALEMARERDARVIVYHVIDEEGYWPYDDERLNPAAALIPRQREKLREFMNEHFPDSLENITELIETGVPYSKIVKKAEEEDIDMIVMSTHGRTGFEQILLGSVTAKVVARAPCPVLSIRPPR
jgi:nucleotide-binding universal stress UspA family protein